MSPRAEICMVLTEIFHAVFDQDDLTLTPTLTAKDVPGWDSFKQIEIIIAIEERYGIELTSKEIDALHNVGDLIAIVTSRTKESKVCLRE